MPLLDHKLYEFDCFVVDAGSRILLKGGVTVRLMPKTFETLLVLVRHAGHVVEKDRLLKEVWPDSFVEEGSLSRNIRELRRSLGDDSFEPRFIETIPKRGYRFIAPVRITGVNPGKIGPIEEIDTVIEKHTFARVISRDIEEESVSRASPFPGAEQKQSLTVEFAEAPPKRKSGRVALIIAVLLLVAAAAVVLYSKRWRATPSISRAKKTLVRLTQKNQIWVMSSDGGNLKQVTSNFANNNRPSWSPDGSKLAFESNRGGNYEIYVMELR